jgi:glycosyltransferase involved in cell wall biosynthesis
MTMIAMPRLRARALQRPRVLMVAPQPFFRVTGTPINVLMMARALTESGLAVDLLVLPGGSDVELPGLRIFRVPRIPGMREVPVGFSLAKILYDVLVLVALVRLIGHHRYAAVHAIEESAFYAVPLARFAGIPAITDLDSDLCRQLGDHPAAPVRALAPLAGILRRLTLPLSSLVISVARELTGIAEREAPRAPVHEINDIPVEGADRPPDPIRLDALRRDFGLGTEPAVVYTGNLDHRQGVEDLIGAMPLVRARHPRARLIVVGGTPERICDLATLAADHGVGEAVTFAGLRPPDEMAEWMGLATVLVSPRLEPYTTPLKIFSYMASGCPIVATDLPTHNQVLDEAGAILVTPGPEGLAAGISRVLDDPAAAEALGRRARDLVEERHTYAIFRQRLIAAYRSLHIPPDLAWPADDGTENPIHG